MKMLRGRFFRVAEGLFPQKHVTLHSEAASGISTSIGHVIDAGIRSMGRNRDYILEKFFEMSRWTEAVNRGIDKDLSQPMLRRFCEPEARVLLYRMIRDGEYRIEPPHTALIPKDTPGEFRTVYVNDPDDRVVLAVANCLFFDLTPDLVHPACKSYLKGTGCGAVVREVARYASAMPEGVIGWKSDLSKYFDSVDIMYIDAAFDRLEERFGHSALVDMVRAYYHDDRYVDGNGVEQRKYMSLRQGCAVSAWLADVILCHIDERLSRLDGKYIRYCDDMLFIGRDHERAMEILLEELGKMRLSLNDGKTEDVRSDRWFSFLGYSVCGGLISLSPRRLARFRKVVDDMACSSKSAKQLTTRLASWLYVGMEWKSWAMQVLPVINSRRDIQLLNAYIMDSIRAAMTGHRRIGGLGYNAAAKEGCIMRGSGRHVASNRRNTPRRIPGFRSLMCMRNALLCSKQLYMTLASACLMT